MPRCAAAEDGRDCNYYAVVPSGIHSSGGGSVVLLDAFEPPADFVISERCAASVMRCCAGMRMRVLACRLVGCAPALRPAGFLSPALLLLQTRASTRGCSPRPSFGA